MSTNFYPILFQPVLKDYIWGGRTLENLGRELPAEGPIAESWEIAGHDDGTTVVSNGRYAGQSLTKVQEQLGLDLIGSNNAWALERDKFPLLVKLLDASRPLSVQVHPEDDYALSHEGNELGKTEMWVVLDAEPGAELILGVAEGTTPEDFRQGIADGKLEPFLHRLPVKKGDHICVPAGTLHAIMGGILIAEIQQNSNTTYRVYDWNRVGADGQPRPVHIDKALDVINFEQVAPQLKPPTPLSEQNGVRREQLCANQYFVTERVILEEGASFNGENDGRSLEIWGVLEGEVMINDVVLAAIQFSLLPAALGAYTVAAKTEATLLRTYVAERSNS
jgi:mannose-6-phosphate isomerase